MKRFEPSREGRDVLAFDVVLLCVPLLDAKQRALEGLGALRLFNERPLGAGMPFNSTIPMLCRSHQLTVQPASRIGGLHGVTELHDFLEHARTRGTLEGMNLIAL